MAQALPPERVSPEIYGYVDFRKFLADYQVARQTWDNAFTRGGISRLLGMPNTRSYFTDVIKGRKVTSTFLERFITILELGEHEGRFFRALVNWNQADYPEEREACFEQLVALNRTPRRDLIMQEYRYYRYWHNSVVRALLNIHDFAMGDVPRLAQLVCPPITTKEAQASVELLLEMSLVAINEQGFIKPTLQCITSGGYAQDELVRHYQLQCLDAAQRSISVGIKGAHNVSTNILTVSPKGYSRIEKRLQKFKEEVRSIVHKDADPAERLYQLSITVLPLNT